MKLLMYKILLFLITLLLCFNFCSCVKDPTKMTDSELDDYLSYQDDRLDKLRDELQKNKVKRTVLFEFKNEEDVKIIEERLSLFEFEILSKDNSQYELNAPSWVVDDVWDVLCSNRDMKMVNENDEVVLDKDDVLSVMYVDGMELLLSVKSEVWQEFYDTLIQRRDFLSDGTNKYELLCSTERKGDDYVISVDMHFDYCDVNFKAFSDSEKSLLYYVINLTTEPLHDEVSVQIIDNNK